MVRDPPSEDLFRLVGGGSRIQNVLESLLRRPSLVADDDAAVARVFLARVADVSTIFALLEHWGWLVRDPGQVRRLRVGEAELRDLCMRFRGMVEGASLVERGAPQVVPIATLPAIALALRAELGENAGDCFETRDGFAHVVSRAKASIIFLVPFMDEIGAEAVAGMLGRCAASRRIVVCRPDSRGVRHHARFVPLLTEAGAEVREYWKARPGNQRPAAETFHAKMVMADRDLVYVGSSNLLSASLDGGLECGVLLEGVHVRPFRRIIEGVLAVSDPLPAESPLPV